MIKDHSLALQYMIQQSYNWNGSKFEEAIDNVIANVEPSIISDFYGGGYKDFDEAVHIHEDLWDLTEDVADKLEL